MAAVCSTKSLSMFPRNTTVIVEHNEGSEADCKILLTRNKNF